MLENAAHVRARVAAGECIYSYCSARAGRRKQGEGRTDEEKVRSPEGGEG